MSTFTETLPKPAPRPLILRRPKETTGFWSWNSPSDVTGGDMVSALASTK